VFSVPLWLSIVRKNNHRDKENTEVAQRKARRQLFMQRHRRGFARKVVLSGFEVFSAASAYLCYLCVKYSRDYSYAEITEIRRGHREESERCKKHFSCNATRREALIINNI